MFTVRFAAGGGMQQIQMIQVRYASRCHRFSASDPASFVSAEFLFYCTSLVFKCDVWLQARNGLLLAFCNFKGEYNFTRYASRCHCFSASDPASFLNFVRCSILLTMSHCRSAAAKLSISRSHSVTTVTQILPLQYQCN